MANFAASISLKQYAACTLPLGNAFLVCTVATGLQMRHVVGCRGTVNYLLQKCVLLFDSLGIPTYVTDDDVR